MIKILIIDTDQEAITKLTQKLKKQIPNLEIITAGNGELAIDIFKNNLPDLVITEVMIPVLNGWKAGKTMHEFAQKNNHSCTFCTLTSIGPHLNATNRNVFGFDIAFDKPLEKKDFITLISLIKKL